MSLWNKLVLGTKFLFGGFESVTDYLLKLLNKFLSGGKISERIQKAREYVATILGYLKKYEKFCPAIWCTHYEKLLAAVQTLLDVFADNRVTPDELDKAIADIKAAITAWME